MKKSKYLPLFTDSGEYNPKLKAYAKKAGVYIIKKSGQIVYIGHSKANVWKTLIRHFQSWDDPSQYRNSYKHEPKDLFRVRIVATPPSKAEPLEYLLIERHNPPDNEFKYQGKPSFETPPNLLKQYEEAPF